MQSLAIVEVDVIGDVCHRFFQVFEFLEVHHLGLETSEEGFHVGIVPAVALAAHTDAKAGGFEGGAIFLGGIFRPLV